jgi:hypothetical protein
MEAIRSPKRRFKLVLHDTKSNKISLINTAVKTFRRQWSSNSNRKHNFSTYSTLQGIVDFRYLFRYWESRWKSRPNWVEDRMTFQRYVGAYLVLPIYLCGVWLNLQDHRVLYQYTRILRPFSYACKPNLFYNVGLCGLRCHIPWHVFSDMLEESMK